MRRPSSPRGDLPLQVAFDDPGVYVIATLGDVQLNVCHGLVAPRHLEQIQRAYGQARERFEQVDMITVVDPGAPSPPRATRNLLVEVLRGMAPGLRRAAWVMAGEGIGARFNRGIMRALLPLLLRGLEAELFVVDSAPRAARALVKARPLAGQGPSADALIQALDALDQRLREAR